MSTFPAAERRARTDLCPGVLRPWPADDGLLVRLRLVGGRLPIVALTLLLDASERFSDGRIHLTKRANLQLRGLPGHGGQLASAALAALESTGLLPSRTHELVRNIAVSPQTGYAGGRADLRPVAARLDALLCDDSRLALLPGRFLFTLDDGRGDLLDRLTATGRSGTDLGLVALGAHETQLRIGDRWGSVVAVADAADHLAGIAGMFLAVRGAGAKAPWHVRELAAPLTPTAAAADPRMPARSGPLPYGVVPGGTHVGVPDGVLTADHGRSLIETARHTTELVVTPWRGILIPQLQETAS